MPPLNAKVVDIAPDEPALTPYDEQTAFAHAYQWNRACNSQSVTASTNGVGLTPAALRAPSSSRGPPPPPAVAGRSCGKHRQ